MGGDLSKIHLKEVCHPHEVEACVGVLLVGIGENEFWQWNALQEVPEPVIPFQQPAVRQCAVHLCMPVIKIYTVSVGLQTNKTIVCPAR